MSSPGEPSALSESAITTEEPTEPSGSSETPAIEDGGSFAFLQGATDGVLTLDPDEIFFVQDTDAALQQPYLP